MKWFIKLKHCTFVKENQKKNNKNYQNDNTKNQWQKNRKNT